MYIVPCLTINRRLRWVFVEIHSGSIIEACTIRRIYGTSIYPRKCRMLVFSLKTTTHRLFDARKKCQFRLTYLFFYLEFSPSCDVSTKKNKNIDAGTEQPSEFRIWLTQRHTRNVRINTTHFNLSFQCCLFKGSMS